MSTESNELYEFGDFRLDIGERKIERSAGVSRGTLPEKSFQTLVHLVRNCGRLVTKEELLLKVWPDAIVEENNLGKAIHSIRHFLGDSSSSPRFIETVLKHGYRFVAEVRKGSAELRVPDEIESSVDRILGVSSSRISAYELYLRGKVKGSSVKRPETEAAIRYLQEAVTIDPSFAEAYAQLARAYIRMAFNFSDEPQRAGFLEEAEVAIEAALSLRPELAEGHFSRGLLLWTHTNRFPHQQAIMAYKRSLASNPDLDETHHQLSMVYGHIGLMDEALVSVRKAIELNPANTMARFRISNYLAWTLRSDDALAVLKTVPNSVSPLLVDRIKAETLIQVGQLDEALKIADSYLNEYPRDEGGSLTSVRALVLAIKGDRSEAQELATRAAEIGNGFGHFHHTAYNIASAYATMNKAEEAVKWLQATSDDGFPNYTYFRLDPNLDNVREHPRFVELMSNLEKQHAHFCRIA